MVVPPALGVVPGDAGVTGHAALLALLADGELQSGERLASALGVSRAAVWKGIRRLRGRGVEIEALARRGYRLPARVEMLREEAIRAAVAEQAARLQGLELLFDVDSTNTRLLAAPPPPPGRGAVVISEFQHAGRGRRGRPWIAPFGASLALSLGWSFGDTARASPSLSLAVGVAVSRALARAGARDMALKWPNDLWLGDRKVGGILLELRAEASGPAYVVIGVGLNVSLTTSVRAAIEATGVHAAAIADACAAVPSRNFIAGAIIGELLSMLVTFEREGFEPFRKPWTALDALRDRRAQVVMGDAVVEGTARGVDEHGALLLERDGRVLTFVSGDVSLRLGGDDI